MRLILDCSLKGTLTWLEATAPRGLNPSSKPAAACLWEPAPKTQSRSGRSKKAKALTPAEHPNHWKGKGRRRWIHRACGLLDQPWAVLLPLGGRGGGIEEDAGAAGDLAVQAGPYRHGLGRGQGGLQVGSARRRGSVGRRAWDCSHASLERSPGRAERRGNTGTCSQLT